MKRIIYIVFIIYAIASIYACQSEQVNNEETTFPEILDISAYRDTIDFGGDTTTLFVNTTGGNITCIWDVDLGDILPIVADGHIALFSGSECCVGIKNIKCTVTNDKGSTEASVKVYIKEPQK